jgi:EAL domain-containing protein (putative c-di-GMP-specific phosphodiesterase class I)
MLKSLMESVIKPGAITALFQPILSIIDDKPRIIAVEGLARGPKDTTLESPDFLFAFARRKNEESIVDRAAIAAILREARRLPSHLPLHLNVHASTLGRDGCFVDFLRKTSTSLGIDLGRLTLEIVEHSNFIEESTFVGALGELRASGISIALDDIGVGMSNFRMMLIARPTKLKIDRSLVTGVAKDVYQQATMRAIRLLADQVHAELVAEGVETSDDLKALRTLGIEYAQGYLFSRPCTAADVTDLLALQGASLRPRTPGTWVGRPNLALVAQAS